MRKDAKKVRGKIGARVCCEMDLAKSRLGEGQSMRVLKNKEKKSNVRA